MRNIRDLITDYVDFMGYDGHEEVNRLMIQYYTADSTEQQRLVKLMLDTVTGDFEEYYLSGKCY